MIRQIATFAGAGIAAAIAHYGVLIALVEWARAPVVASTLAGYLCGGVTSYALNARHTFAAEPRARDAIVRFIAVAAVGFVLTGLLMRQFVERWGAPYLPAQVVTTGVVLVWSFMAHKYFTFRARPRRAR